MSENGIVFSNGNLQPIQIGANALSAVPNCELSSTYAYFGMSGAYAKSRFKIGLINNVQALPYGSQMLNGMRDILNVTFSGNFTGN